MDDLTFRIIFLSIGCVIAIVFNLSVLRKTGFVDTPLDGWFGKLVKAKPEDKEERLEAYRRQARRNFWVIGLLLLLLLRDIFTWLTSGNASP